MPDVFPERRYVSPQPKLHLPRIAVGLVRDMRGLGILEPGNTLILYGLDTRLKRTSRAPKPTPSTHSILTDIPTGNFVEDQLTPLYRVTRSNKAFSPWAQPRATAPNPQFNFEALYRASTDRADAAENSATPDLSDLSPLSSPEPTPPPSPETTCADLPIDRADTAETSAILDSDLSPLPSPEPTPPPSPETTCANLPIDPQPTSPPPVHSSSPPLLGKVLFESTKKPKPHKAHRNKKSHASRRRRRAETNEATFGNYQVRQKVVQRYSENAKCVKCNMDTKNAKVTSTGFTGKDDGERSQRVYSLDEMVGEGSKFNFELHPWDGRTPNSIVDSEGRVVAVLAGHPHVPNWPALQQQGAQALEERRSRCCIPRKDRIHRRGAFVALRCGFSHGGGQTHPTNLKNNSKNAQVLEELNDLEPFKRLAGFASACMASWAPRLYKHYSVELGKLLKHDPSLKRIFPSGIFSAATYNFGPRTMCFKHRDFSNLPYGWCAVSALGSFDPSKGGHLILWDCHLVVEFPPGSTILLPSAVLAHSNVSVAAHERRYSFAQYSAGALFRWVANGFMKATDRDAKLSKEEKEQVHYQNKKRWLDGLAMLPKLSTK